MGDGVAEQIKVPVRTSVTGGIFLRADICLERGAAIHRPAWQKPTVAQSKNTSGKSYLSKLLPQ